MEDTKEDLFKVANNIEDLKKLGYILDVEVDLDKKLILYKKNKTNKKTDNCINCGCLIDFSSDKVSKNCNLCGKKIKKNGRK